MEVGMSSRPASRRSSLPPDKRIERRRRILEAGSLDRVLDYLDGEEFLRIEAADRDPSKRLLAIEHLLYLLKLRDEKRKTQQKPNLAFSSDDVVIVPGFFASGLRDVSGTNGSIWIDPKLFESGKSLSVLELRRFDKNELESEVDEEVRIQACGHIPATVEMLSLYLEFWRYSVRVFAFDWRKNLQCAADLLADQIRARISRAFRPLHIIAHSLGAVVARRALQILGTDTARRLVSNLILVGPLSQGSFSPALVLAGDISQIDLLRLYGISPPQDFGRVLQTFTALYQLLPWRLSSSAGLRTDAFFGLKGIDGRRLKFGIEWARSVDSRFFDDRTTILLGDKKTPSEFSVNKGRLVASGKTAKGDGVVTDQQALLDDVRAYRMPEGEHSRLLLYPQVHSAIRAILKNETPDLSPPRHYLNPKQYLSIREYWKRPVPKLRVEAVAPQRSAITTEA
jgi:pimeloyl-ACP methyl ester carboxylesterase